MGNLWALRVCMWRACMLLTLAALLTSCGGRAPAVATPGASAANERVRGEDLPGRLLFVRRGVIWLWQGREAGPLLGAGEAAQPAWSPEGERIAYIARSNSFSDLLLADANGNPLAQLTTNGSDAPPNSIERVYASRWSFYPAWTPQGAGIVVATQAAPPDGDPPVDAPLALALVPTLPGEPLPLYSDSAAVIGRSAVSPNGAALVLTRMGTGPEGQQQLYRLELTSAEAAPLPGAPTPSYDPAFSPDGRWLAFAARDGATTDIFVLPAEGGVPLRLSAQGAARAPSFSPDGALLAFLAVAPGEAGFDLWVAALTVGAGGTIGAGPARRLTTGLGLDGDSGLSWAP